MDPPRDLDLSAVIVTWCTSTECVSVGPDRSRRRPGFLQWIEPGQYAFSGGLSKIRASWDLPWIDDAVEIEVE